MLLDLPFRDEYNGKPIKQLASLETIFENKNQQLRKILKLCHLLLRTSSRNYRKNQVYIYYIYTINFILGICC